MLEYEMYQGSSHDYLKMENIAIKIPQDDVISKLPDKDFMFFTSTGILAQLLINVSQLQENHKTCETIPFFVCLNVL
jgi:hypothetical protein